MNWDAAILIALKILAVLVLVLMNGFFVAAEFSLVRIRETQLDMLVAKNRRRAKMAQHIVRNLNSYLSATQLGITMASLGLGWIGQPVFTKLLSPLLVMLGVNSLALQESISFAVGFSALTFFHITVGELAPKWLTIQKPLPVALWSAYPLHWFYIAFYPFNRLLNRAARYLLQKIGSEPGAKSCARDRKSSCSIPPGRLANVSRSRKKPATRVFRFATAAIWAKRAASSTSRIYTRFATRRARREIYYRLREN